MPQYKLSYIFTDQQLADTCRILAEAKYLAVDTEFERRDTYFAILCLIQICHEDEVYIIDPFEISDFSPLTALFANPDIAKIFHATQEDVEVLFNSIGGRIHHLLDTQAAYGLLGRNASIGYQAMVEELVNVKIEKEANHKDWKNRPLSDAQLQYAAQDVIHLIPCLMKLLPDLEQKNRDSWLRQHGEWQAQPSRFTTNPADAWLRYKLAWKLKSAEVATLQTIAAWNEEQAIRKDIPRNRVVRNEFIYQVAEALPRSLEDLEKFTKMPPPVIKRFGSQILTLVEESLERASAVDQQAFFKFQTKRDQTLKAIRKRLEDHGKSLGIPPAFIASRRTLIELTEYLMKNGADNDAIKTIIGEWQANLLQSEIEEICSDI